MLKTRELLAALPGRYKNFELGVNSVLCSKNQHEMSGLIDIVQRRFIEQTVREKKRRLPCCAGKLTLVLTESGEVYRCESFRLHMGDVREYGCDLGELREGALAQQAVEEVGGSECHCTRECYMMMNILFNLRLYPALLKEYLRLA